MKLGRKALGRDRGTRRRVGREKRDQRDRRRQWIYPGKTLGRPGQTVQRHLAESPKGLAT